MNWELLTGFGVALFAILNPIGKLPIFVGVTGNMRPGVRRAVAVLISGFVLVLLVAFLFTGKAILDFFGISLPAFQVAGGIILMLVGLSMVWGRPQTVEAATSRGESLNDFEEAQSRLRHVLVPLAVPMLVGPGAISVVILYADKVKTGGEWAGMVVVLFVVSVITMLILMAANPIARAIGENGLEIATRILGLLTTAIGVQFILVGLAKVTTIFNMKGLGM